MDPEHQSGRPLSAEAEAQPPQAGEAPPRGISAQVALTSHLRDLNRRGRASGAREILVSGGLLAFWHLLQKRRNGRFGARQGRVHPSKPLVEQVGEQLWHQVAEPAHSEGQGFASREVDRALRSDFHMSDNMTVLNTWWQGQGFDGVDTHWRQAQDPNFDPSRLSMVEIGAYLVSAIADNAEKGTVWTGLLEQLVQRHPAMGDALQRDLFNQSLMSGTAQGEADWSSALSAAALHANEPPMELGAYQEFILNPEWRKSAEESTLTDLVQSTTYSAAQGNQQAQGIVNAAAGELSERNPEAAQVFEELRERGRSSAHALWTVANAWDGNVWEPQASPVSGSESAVHGVAAGRSGQHGDATRGVHAASSDQADLLTLENPKGLPRDEKQKERALTHLTGGRDRHADRPVQESGRTL